MGIKTGISWCDATWNPVVGCSHISPGCDNCYAEEIASRFSGCSSNGTVRLYHGVINDLKKWNGKTEWRNTSFHPTQTKSAKTIFVCSMGDLFHESVPFEWVDEILRVIYATPHHRYMILTKRPQRMREYFDGISEPGTNSSGSVRMPRNMTYNQCGLHGLHMRYLQGMPLDNLALGVTVESQEYIKRVLTLVGIPAKKRFISIEPMIAQVDLSVEYFAPLLKQYPLKLQKKHRTKIIDSLDLVICGGESGSKSRPISDERVRRLRDQCDSFDVPFHFKGFGKPKVRTIDGREFGGVIDWAIES